MLRPEVRANDFLVAGSKAVRAVAEQVESYADGEAPILITGEHGTGRELVARVLHQRGPRGSGRFVAVRPTFEGGDVPQVAGDDACQRARRALVAATGGTLLLDCELGWLTIPEPPLEIAKPASAPAELALAP